jgi:acyl-CoA thioester hydrolase
VPYTYNYKVTVRSYECDAYRRVRPAVLLQYMQEAAIAASASVGYSPTRYDEIGLLWLAYETDLRILRPITREDSLVINTWVADMRRVRSLRRYELYCDGVIVGEASTDWVLLNRSSLHPTTVPDDMVEAYAQGDPPTDPLPRHGIDMPPVPEDAFHMQRRVEIRDIDMAAHVNNAVYLYYVEDAEERALTAAGWPVSRLESEGVMLAPTRISVAYKQAAVLGDLLDLYTWTGDVTDGGGVRYALIKRGDRIVTQIRVEWGAFNLKTGEVLTLAPDLLAVFR